MSSWLWALGMPGVLVMAWAMRTPMGQRYDFADLPDWLPALFAGLQYSVLLAMAALVGAWITPRLGLGAPVLHAWLAGRPVGPVLHSQWLPAIGGGVVGAGWIVAFSQLTPSPMLLPTDPLQALPLYVKLLYSGLTEEVMLRWGVMTAACFCLWRWLQPQGGFPRPNVVWGGIVLGAAVFGLMHLPAALALFGGVPMPLSAALYLVLGNTVLGLLSGYLYWRYGLETSIMAHVLAMALSHGLS